MDGKGTAAGRQNFAGLVSKGKEAQRRGEKIFVAVDGVSTATKKSIKSSYLI
jgi:hypothetical protein